MTLKTDEITTGADIIDVRDVIARYEELDEERKALKEALEESRAALLGALTDKAITETQNAVDLVLDALTEWEGDNTAEYDLLKALLDDLCGNGGDEQWNGDWYPVTLIRDSYFNEAMDELLDDIGEVPKDLPSYLTITVDYDALQTDYSSVEFDGVTYWYR